MRHLLATCLLICVCTGLATRDVSAQTPPSLPSVAAEALQKDRVILAAQPNADDFRRWHAMGVRHVLNVRTPAEMERVSAAGLDEAALLAKLGISYTQVPLGGDAFPMRQAPVDALRDLLGKDDGLVLLHCASASRAGQVWAGHQVRDVGRAPTEVYRELEPLGLWPLPLEQLSGIPMEIEAQR